MAFTFNPTGGVTDTEQFPDADPLIRDKLQALLQQIPNYTDAQILAMDRYSKVYVGEFTRDLSIAGVQSITNIGFKPKIILCLALVNGTVGKMSIGMWGNNKSQAILENSNSTMNSWNRTNSFVFINNGGSNNTSGANIVTTATGFNITWVKSLTGATGIVSCNIMCIG